MSFIIIFGTLSFPIVISQRSNGRDNENGWGKSVGLWSALKLLVDGFGAWRHVELLVSVTWRWVACYPSCCSWLTRLMVFATSWRWNINTACVNTGMLDQVSVTWWWVSGVLCQVLPLLHLTDVVALKRIYRMQRWQMIALFKCTTLMTTAYYSYSC